MSKRQNNILCKIIWSYYQDQLPRQVILTSKLKSLVHDVSGQICMESLMLVLGTPREWHWGCCLCKPLHFATQSMCLAKANMPVTMQIQHLAEPKRHCNCFEHFISWGPLWGSPGSDPDSPWLSLQLSTVSMHEAMLCIRWWSSWSTLCHLRPQAKCQSLFTFVAGRGQSITLFLKMFLEHLEQLFDFNAVNARLGCIWGWWWYCVNFDGGTWRYCQTLLFKFCWFNKEAYLCCSFSNIFFWHPDTGNCNTLKYSVIKLPGQGWAGPSHCRPGDNVTVWLFNSPNWLASLDPWKTLTLLFKDDLLS